MGRWSSPAISWSVLTFSTWPDWTENIMKTSPCISLPLSPPPTSAPHFRAIKSRSQSPNAANLFILISIKEVHVFLTSDFPPTACMPWFFGYTSHTFAPLKNHDNSILHTSSFFLSPMRPSNEAREEVSTCLFGLAGLRFEQSGCFPVSFICLASFSNQKQVECPFGKNETSRPACCPSFCYTHFSARLRFDGWSAR